MRQWWLLPLGIGIVLIALFMLLRGDGLPQATGPPPLDQIDDASRAKLDRVLREAERE